MSAVWALSAFLMTLAGGAFAFRYQRYLLFIMAFSAGLVIGVSFLDLLPEVVEIARVEGIAIRALMLTVIAGFVGIFLLEKLTIIHGEKQHDAPGHHHNVGLAALAPVAGALLANVLQIEPRLLAFQLAFFAGFLLYLGASDLLPQVHQTPRATLLVFTLAGIATAG